MRDAILNTFVFKSLDIFDHPAAGTLRFAAIIHRRTALASQPTRARRSASRPECRVLLRKLRSSDIAKQSHENSVHRTLNLEIEK